jgi:hypothetical protein
MIHRVGVSPSRSSFAILSNQLLLSLAILVLISQNILLVNLAIYFIFPKVVCAQIRHTKAGARRAYPSIPLIGLNFLPSGFIPLQNDSDWKSAGPSSHGVAAKHNSILICITHLTNYQKNLFINLFLVPNYD